MTKIVRIGGGSSAHVLRGLMRLPNAEVTAIVPMSDSGGSSGELRDRWGVLPPSDALRSALALSDFPEAEWAVVNRFLRHRLKGNGVENHAVGNLLLAGIQRFTHSFESAVRALEQALCVKEKVVPVTIVPSDAVARLSNNTIVDGETHIDIPKEGRPLLPIVGLSLKPNVPATSDALSAICEADVVVIGPGDLYTSVGCCLVVDGIAASLQCTRARLVYVMNIMTKRGETGGFEGGHPDFKASDFLRVIEGWVGRRMDHVLCNNEVPPPHALERYASEGAHPVEGDLIAGRDLQGQRVWYGDFLDHLKPEEWETAPARHSARRTAAFVGMIAAAEGDSASRAAASP